MFQNFNSIQKNLDEIISEQLPIIFTSKINIHQLFIFDLLDLQQGLNEIDFNKNTQTQILVALMKYKERTSEILQDYISTYSKTSLKPAFTSYYKAIDSYTDSLDSSVTIVQDKDRFHATSEDTKFVKLKKFVKRSGFKIETFPKRVGYAIKGFQKKEQRSISYWEQKIALQGVTSYYYNTVLLERTEALFANISKEIAQTIKDCWDTDHQLDKQLIDYVENGNQFQAPDTVSKREALKVRFSELEKNIVEELKEIQKSTALDYEIALSKSGTLELNNAKFSEPKLAEAKASAQKNRLNQAGRWNNAFLVLTDDWGVDLEIYRLIFKTNQSYVKLENQVKENSKLIVEQLDLLKEYQQGDYDRIKNTVSNQELSEAIHAELKALKLKYNARLLPTVTQKISELELTSVINSFESTLNSLLQKISKKRTLSKDFDFLSPIPASGFSSFSPYELINYESWPVFLKQINKAKVEMTLKFNDTIQTLNELSNIVQFNLESSLALLEENQSSKNDAKKVAIEGLQRNLDKLDNMYPKVEAFGTDVSKILQDSIIQFKDSIISFTESENILQLKLVIAKAKSIEKSKEVRNKIKGYIIYAIPLIRAGVIKYYLQSVGFVKSKMLRYGLLASEKTINKELSDFLLEAEKSVNKLPFIYQRLFRSETLTNESFFSGNQTALETLTTAYNLWENDRYRTTIIIGEKGSGKTSLLNYFSKKKKISSQTITLRIKKTIYTNAQLFAFLSEEFSKELTSVDALINFLNTSKKQSIIIENLQHLYIRKINGFEALHTLLEVIALTETNIFWMTTCSKYSYNYLNKTIFLSEQFTTVIDLDDANIEILIEAISVRHKASGYGLYFEEPPKEFLSKKYQKENSELERQKFLERDFYEDLFKISKNNFKIAFMYWLRSATSVQGSKIHLRSLKEIDLSFIEHLSTGKLFVLNIILHHEQLKLEHIADILGLNTNEIKRLTNSLFEDGLLIKNEEYFTINTLLYRQVIALLKSKNFIH